MLTAKDAWQATLGQLQVQLNRATFDTWLKGAELLAYEDGEFVIRVRHAYAKDWLAKHLSQQITQTLGDIFGRSVKVNFVVYLPQHNGNAPANGPLFAASGNGHIVKPVTSTPAIATSTAPDTADSAPAPASAAETPTTTDQPQASQPEGIPSVPASQAETSTTEPAADVPAAQAGPEPTQVQNGQDVASPPESKSGTAIEMAAGDGVAEPAVPDDSEWDPRVNHIRRTSDLPVLPGIPFNSGYTFESFVTGPNNQFAYAAAKAVAEGRGTYNPLLIYGGAGLGKTHLMHAIGQVAEDGGRRVLYVTAETFTNEMVAAIRTHATDDFRARYRQVDVLLVDDVQFMAGKTKTEEEFYHTFNAIFARGGQIVIASNQSPRRLENLDDRLRSRFEGGLMADIQSPQFETRLAILRSKSQAQGATLPDEVAGLLARPATENVRELEGMLTQLIARATLSQQPITLALAEQVLNQSSDQPRRRTTNLDRILEATATYHQLSLDDLLSKRRTKDIVRARQIAMYLAREETEASYPQIGRALGGRNHSTVVYGYQKIAGQVEEDPDLRQHVSDLRRQIYLFSKD